MVFDETFFSFKNFDGARLHQNFRKETKCPVTDQKSYKLFNKRVNEINFSLNFDEEIQSDSVTMNKNETMLGNSAFMDE